MEDNNARVIFNIDKSYRSGRCDQFTNIQNNSYKSVNFKHNVFLENLLENNLIEIATKYVKYIYMCVCCMCVSRKRDKLGGESQNSYCERKPNDKRTIGFGPRLGLK